MPARIPREKELKIIELYKKGCKLTHIGEKFNILPTSVSRIIRRNNVPRKGHGEGDLTKKHKYSIIESYKKGSSQREIAQKYNISRGLVVHILNKYNIKCRSNSEAKRKYKVNEQFFDIINTEEKAYWLGFITADGQVKKGIRIRLMPGDIQHLKKFKNDIGSEHKIVIRKGSGFAKQTYYCDIAIPSMKLEQAMFKLGLTRNKTHEVKSCKLVPNYLLRHYWRGIIDGDGCISIHHNGTHVSLTGNKHIVNGFKSFICRFLKSQTQIMKYKNRNAYRICFGGDYLTKKISELLYKDSNIYLDRKMKRANKIMKNRPKKQKISIIDNYQPSIEDYYPQINYNL